MNGIKWNFFILATIAALSIVGIGIFFAENSSLGMIICFILLCVAMMYGFKSKKKLRQER
ncbi:YlaF family protein [Bacillus niameyensis]|uniref:YlaF family protein n=1 Tax=Bacillus niameyensis TaxID=1522308 RepID=UPI00078216C8|nr:YlaF family protein [Bacillus niameyensis]